MAIIELPVSGYFSNAARINSEAKTAHDDNRDILSRILSIGYDIGNADITISSDSISPANKDHGGVLIVDTQALAATDDLATIDLTNVKNGQILLLRAKDAGRTVVVKHNVGNILLSDNQDFSLDALDKWLAVIVNGANVEELFRNHGSNSAGLNSIAGLTTAADRMLYTTGADTYAVATLTAAGRALLDDASASDQRTTLELGSLATLNSINNGNWSGADLAVANGGTGASDTTSARNNLGLGTGNSPSFAGLTLNGTMKNTGQSSFLAENSAHDLNVTGATVSAKVEFDSEIFDQNGDYNTSTDTFTAPVTGRYLFTASVFITGLTTSHGQTALTITTSNRTYQTIYGGGHISGGTMGLTISRVCDMDASDTAFVEINVSNGSQVVDVFGGLSLTGFSGCLLH